MVISKFCTDEFYLVKLSSTVLKETGKTCKNIFRGVTSLTAITIFSHLCI